MITEIVITGQISGNFKLRNAIINAECVERSTPYGIVLTFATKKAAVKALSNAYKYMALEMPEQKNSIGGIKYLRGHTLAYDASRAQISQ